MGQGTVMDPVEAPVRRVTTLKLRFEFFEENYADNYGLIEQLRTALKVQNAVLVWEDDYGVELLNRRVVGIDDTNDMHFWGQYQGMESMIGYTPFIDQRKAHFWWYSGMLSTLKGAYDPGFLSIPIAQLLIVSVSVVPP